MTDTDRLDISVQAVCPIHGVSVSRATNPPTVRIDFKTEATAPQRSAAQAVVDSFDWSQSAHDAWEGLQARTPASATVDGTDYVGKLIRALASILVDEINILRQQVVGVAQSVWDPASMANGAGVTSPNFTVTGAAFGDVVDVAAPYSLQGVIATGYVSAANTVVVRLQNGSGGNVNLASGTWGVVVRRHTAMPDRTLAQARNALKNKINNGDVDS